MMTKTNKKQTLNTYMGKPLVWSKNNWMILLRREGDENWDPSFTVLNEKTGFADYPIKYDSGVIAFDRPDAIPQYVQKALEDAYRQ